MHSVKTIRLVVFCEDYWSKGLIYTQNILPLIKMAENGKYKVEIYSFTSIFSYYLNKKKIKNFKEEMKNFHIDVVDMFTLYYPTRYLTTRWELLPFYKANVVRYIKHLNKKDSGKNVCYNIRSYEAALGFLLYYDNKKNLVFDTRTDWIEENINAGTFAIGSKSEKYWTQAAADIIMKFKKTLVISDVFKNNLIERYGEKVEPNISVVYNPIDYSKFKLNHIIKPTITFLYTGSFGQWNRLSTYLSFFKKVYAQIKNVKLIICTGTSRNRIQPILDDTLYDEIRDSIEIHYNVAIDNLPKIYSQCDYGLQLMTKKDSRVGVKFVEYIAAGVFPIVSANVQGAAFLVNKYKLGAVVENMNDLNNVISLISARKQIDKNSSNYQSFKEETDLAQFGTILTNIFTS